MPPPTRSTPKWGHTKRAKLPNNILRARLPSFSSVVAAGDLARAAPSNDWYIANSSSLMSPGISTSRNLLQVVIRHREDGSWLQPVLFTVRQMMETLSGDVLDEGKRVCRALINGRHNVSSGVHVRES